MAGGAGIQIGVGYVGDEGGYGGRYEEDEEQERDGDEEMAGEWNLTTSLVSLCR